MIALDTNVLIRVLVAAALEGLLANKSLFVFEDVDVFRKALDASIGKAR